MTTAVTIKHEGPTNDITVREFDPVTSNVVTSAVLTAGEEKTFYVHSSQALVISEVDEQ